MPEGLPLVTCGAELRSAESVQQHVKHLYDEGLLLELTRGLREVRLFGAPPCGARSSGSHAQLLHYPCEVGACLFLVMADMNLQTLRTSPVWHKGWICFGKVGVTHLQLCLQSSRSAYLPAWALCQWAQFPTSAETVPRRATEGRLVQQ